MRQVLFLLSKDNARGPSLCLHLPLSQDQLECMEWNAQKRQEAGANRQQINNVTRVRSAQLEVGRAAASRTQLPSAGAMVLVQCRKQAASEVPWPELLLAISLQLHAKWRYRCSAGYLDQLPPSARGSCHVWRLPPRSQSPISDCLELFEPSIPASQTQAQHTPIHAAIVIPVTCRTLHLRLRPRHFFRLLPAAADL
jgi:hypothetical protein